MKIVVALDSFKGTLRAVEACAAAAEGLRAALPDATVLEVPLADGGEGTAETLMAAHGGSWVPVRVVGPLAPREVDAGFVWLAERQGAVVEMAVASGLPLLAREERNPLITTTYGTGQLLTAAIERGAKRLWLGVGGSATVDGGVGAASALGWRFLDDQGEPLPPGGAALARLAAIEPPPERERMPPVEVLCDVDNPLLGERGAAAVFGPQKGATPEQVDVLERSLARLAEVVQRDLGVDLTTLEGAGAAGGLAAGCVAFFDATLVAGIDAIMDACGLDPLLADATWAVTGEGRFDEQSLHGKVVSGVATRAARAQAKVAVLAGRIELAAERAGEAGIAAMEAATAPSDPVPETAAEARAQLIAAATRLGQRLN
ncbi:MAG: glycerate kinase [Planctomycetota bacterium]|nr:glycerate kinase [Planctomycetota bacterium]